eukprot:15474579-Alexandrium_andersonii.AAC.1
MAGMLPAEVYQLIFQHDHPVAQAFWVHANRMVAECSPVQDICDSQGIGIDKNKGVAGARGSVSSACWSRSASPLAVRA